MPPDAGTGPDASAPEVGGPTREATLHRVIAFNDAVVAIAMTLLVLPLVDLAQTFNPKASAATMLRENYGEIIAFVVSFLVVMRVWAGHRRLYDALVDYDEGLLGLNTWWLMAVVFLPFPTARLFAQTHVSRGSVLFYLVTLFVIAVAGVAQSALALHRPRWIRPGQGDAVRLHRAASAALCVVFVVAALLAVVQPVLGLFALLLSPLTRWPVRRATRRSGGWAPRVV